MLTRTLPQETTQRKRKDSLPKLRWPLPSAGCDLEIARWWYEPTKRRNGGDWIYIVRVYFWDEDQNQPEVLVEMRCWRVREQYTTKRRFDSEFVLSGPQLEVSRNSKRAPKHLSRAFDEFVSQVSERAEKDRLRYERIMEAQPW